MANHEPSKIGLGLRRGLGLRCPECGQGRLFRRFLKVAEACEECGTDNTRYPSDDAPPYLTIVIVGHVILPLAILSYEAWLPFMWLNLGIWTALAIVMTLAMLPFVKGAVVGFAWATGVTRETARQ